MSTAILQLSENGDLQRIHDKWLLHSACSSDTTEIESDQLQLKSFWGLFLICGVACFSALFIYFVQIMLRLCRTPPDSVSEGSNGSLSVGVRRLISLLDEKEDLSNQGSKRRKVERSLSDNSKESELGSITRKQTEITAIFEIYPSTAFRLFC